MIDAHIHVVPPNLPGVGPLSPGLRASVENVARVVREQMLAGGFTHAAAMGAWDAGPDDPLGVARTLQIARSVPGLYAIGVADPTRTDKDHLRRAEAQIAAGRVVALKGYLGYLHHYSNDPGYRPYFELAARFKLPVFFHTGDTYSPYAKLKFAHPLTVDEVAVDFPTVSFVLCHVGNPWTVDAAEVVYKNMNVWTDLSGLLVGPEEDFTDEARNENRRDVIERIRLAFRYAERPNRFLYGSDWPLAPMPAYADFIREAIPAEFHEMVFAENARKLFGDRMSR
ncbi:MAG TPA: amidohydrolase family protein [Gemmataceae bacterium]|nr:amidohydrolase family protein [Gemmataceae bacterium]